MHLPALSAYTQWKWHSPDDALARSEGVGLAAGTPEAVGAAAATGCVRKGQAMHVYCVK